MSREFSIEALKSNRSEHAQTIKFLEKEIERVAADSALLAEKKQKFERHLDQEKRLLREAEDLLLVFSPPSADLRYLRDTFLNYVGKVAEINFSEEEIHTHEQEARQILKKLQGVCAHPFVFEYSGDAGTQYEHIESAEGYARMCVVCGYVEDSKSPDEHIYGVLADNVTGRIVEPAELVADAPRRGWAHELPELLRFEEIQRLFIARQQQRHSLRTVPVT